MIFSKSDIIFLCVNLNEKSKYLLKSSGFKNEKKTHNY